MAELTQQMCCTPDHLATCCEPSAKADCCGGEDDCGCEAGTAVHRVLSQAAPAIIRARKPGGRRP
jgi:hypothetical protein